MFVWDRPKPDLLACLDTLFQDNSHSIKDPPIIGITNLISHSLSLLSPQSLALTLLGPHGLGSELAVNSARFLPQIDSEPLRPTKISKIIAISCTILPKVRSFLPNPICSVDLFWWDTHNHKSTNPPLCSLLALAWSGLQGWWGSSREDNKE